MQSKLLGLGLIVTTIAAFPLTSLAETNIAVGSQSITRNIVNISPIDLVDAAYQGRFIGSGIPSHGRFISGISSNKINFQVLIEAAIKSGRLESEKINNPSYVSTVKDMLALKLRGE